MNFVITERRTDDEKASQATKSINFDAGAL
jgi:hypothetical protein